METRSKTLGQDLKAWAAEQLQVEPGAAPTQIRAAYLRQVQHENGAPNLTAREALLILTGRTNAARPALALEAVEEALQREVDAFASRFFALAFAERKAEWDNLKARGQGFLRVDARLTSLRPGLYIVMPRLDGDPHGGELVSAIRKLFVLRPAARAAARQACVDEAKWQNKGQLWAQAAQLLRKQHRAIAALEPDLIAKLADGQVLAEQKARLNRKMRNAAQAVAMAGTAQKSNFWWLVVPAILFCTTCLRIWPSAPQTRFRSIAATSRVHPQPKA